MKGVFKDSREEGETALRQCQIVMLRMLRIFHQICEENNLIYWLDTGTLLGAIRHKGFIPWDDDLDVSMPRKDFDTFNNIAQDYLPEDIFLQTAETDKGFRDIQGFTKLRDKYSTVIEGSQVGRKIDYHQGIAFDIFPADYVEKHKKKLCLIISRFMGNKMVYIGPMNMARFIKQVIKLPFYILREIITYKRCLSFYRWLCTRENGEFVMQPIKVVDFKLFLSKKDLFPIKKATFENFEFYVPSNPHEYLNQLYGDYMKIPPKDKRRCHSVEILPMTPCTHKEALLWTKRNKENC